MGLENANHFPHLGNREAVSGGKQFFPAIQCECRTPAPHNIYNKFGGFEKGMGQFRSFRGVIESIYPSPWVLNDMKTQGRETEENDKWWEGFYGEAARLEREKKAREVEPEASRRPPEPSRPPSSHFRSSSSDDDDGSPPPSQRPPELEEEHILISELDYSTSTSHPIRGAPTVRYEPPPSALRPFKERKETSPMTPAELVALLAQEASPITSEPSPITTDVNVSVAEREEADAKAAIEEEQKARAIAQVETVIADVGGPAPRPK
jgi:hypothetical protein